MFPVNDSAQTVVNALLQQLDKLKIAVKKNSPVHKVFYHENNKKTVELKSGESFETKALILAAGGKSVPQTGSTGDGYVWAKKAGHTITDLFPTEVPVISKETFIKAKTLQGLSLGMFSSVLNAKGKAIVTHRMDMIFTHFGHKWPCCVTLQSIYCKRIKEIIQSGSRCQSRYFSR